MEIYSADESQGRRAVGGGRRTAETADTRYASFCQNRWSRFARTGGVLSCPSGGRSIRAIYQNQSPPGQRRFHRLQPHQLPVSTAGKKEINCFEHAQIHNQLLSFLLLFFGRFARRFPREYVRFWKRKFFALPQLCGLLRFSQCPPASSRSPPVSRSAPALTQQGADSARRCGTSRRPGTRHNAFRQSLSPATTARCENVTCCHRRRVDVCAQHG